MDLGRLWKVIPGCSTCIDLTEVKHESLLSAVQSVGFDILDPDVYPDT